MENNEKQAMDWLLAQGISKDVLRASQIRWDDATQTIVIPVFDIDGKFLFNKSRRAPWLDAGPKYKYDAGAKPALYNSSLVRTSNPIFCVEGEKDSLVMLSRGYNAVSTTGGSGTFLPEWVPLFNGKQVYICYDMDDAGIKGAFKVQQLIPHAKIIWLPKGKDVTEFFLMEEKGNTVFENLVASARSYRAPMVVDWDAKKSDIKKVIQENEAMADVILTRRDMAIADGIPSKPLEMLLGLYNMKNEADRKRHNYMSAKTPGGEDRLKAAKVVRMTNFLEFPASNTIRCLWHTEDTPSMHWYPAQNIAYCFGCAKKFDVVDVVMQQRKVGLVEAIDIILKK